MATLSPIFRMVARDIAIGIPIEDIAELRNIPIEQIKKVAEGQTFCKAVSRIQDEIDAVLVQEEAGDPIRAKMKALAMRSVDRLGIEIESPDDEDSTASAATRIKAASTILQMIGYGKQEQQTNLAVIMLSPDKLSSLRSVDDRHLESVPDMVDG